jgi:hypothetical protein
MIQNVAQSPMLRRAAGALAGEAVFIALRQACRASRSAPRQWTYRVSLGGRGSHVGGETWSRGGDYFGMAATTDGVFHVLWSDARANVFQLWTATVDVRTR